MAIDRQTMDELLGLETSEGEVGYQTRYLQRGPARLNRLIAFMEGQANCFQHYETTSRSRSTKKPQIIFANGLIRERMPGSKELKLLSALLSHYEVYPWKEDEFANVKPIKKSHEFLDEGNIEGATAEAVKARLVAQNINPNNYIILDHANYSELGRRYAQKIKATRIYTTKTEVTDRGEIVPLSRSHSSFLNLMKYPSLAIGRNQKKLLSSVDPLQIKHIALPAPTLEVLEFVLTHFQNLTDLDIRGVNQEWLDRMSSLIKKNQALFKKLHLSFQYPVGEEFLIHYPETHLLEILSTDLPKIKIGKSETLEGLVITEYQAEKSEWDISGCTNLSTLILHGKPEIVCKFPKTCPKLSKLVLRNMDLKNVDISKYPNLADLELENCTNLEALDLQKLPKLTRLHITKCKSLKKINIDNPALTNIHIVENNKNLVVQLKKCGSLTSLTTDRENFFDKSENPLFPIDELQELTLESLPNITNGNQFQKFLKLRRLQLSGCKNLKGLVTPPGLHRLDLRGYKDEVLDVSQSTVLTELMYDGVLRFDISKLKKLKQVKLIFREGFNLTNNRNIKELFICEFKDLAEIGNATHVRINDASTDVVDLRTTKIKYLSIQHQKWDFLIKAPDSLESLELYSSQTISLENVIHLKYLHLHEVSNFKPDQPLINLEELFLQNSGYWPDFYPNLRRMHLASCSLYNLPTKNLATLEELIITDNQDLSELDLSACHNLTRLVLKNCSGLKKLILPNPSNLRSIELEENVKLSTIDLKYQFKLKELQIDTSNAIDLKNVADCVLIRNSTLTVGNPEKYVDIFPGSVFSKYADSKNSLENKSNLPPSNKQKLKKKNTYSHLALDEKQELVKKNKLSRTAIFSLVKKGERMVAGERVGPADPYEAFGNLTLTIESKDFVSTFSHRMEIWDKVYYKNGVVSFGKNDTPLQEVKDVYILPFTAEDVQFYLKLAKSSDQDAVAILGGNLKAGEIYPLITNQAMKLNPGVSNFNPRCNPPDAITLFWNPEEQQFYARCNKSAKVEILYHYKLDPNYGELPHQIPTMVDLKTVPEDFLPADLVNDLRKLVATIPELEFLTKEIKKEDIPDHVQAIKNYCATFSTPPDKKELTALQSIKLKEGSCHQRSNSFTILMRMMGAMVRPKQSEKHQQCEVAFPAKDGTLDWREVDLGGTSMTDFTLERVNPFVGYEKLALEREAQEAKAPPLHPKVTETIKVYDEIYRNLVADCEIRSPLDLQKKEFTLAPFINLREGQNPLRVHQLIVEQLTATQFDVDKKFVFINSAEDFRIFLSSYRIVNGVRNPADSALKELIQNGGILLVNWNNFDANEMVTYQSIIDDSDPRISGQAFDKEKLRVIGMGSSKTASCSAFLSRCQQCTLHADFFAQKETKKLPTPEAKIEEIHLFQRADWMEQLLGTIYVEGNQYKLTEGPLIQALRNGKSILLHNPPDDPRFHILIHRINVEKKLFFNGEWIVNKGCQVIVDSLDYTPPSDNVIFEGNETKKQPVYIGLHNFHELYERVKATPDKRAKILPGLIKDYDASSEIFYLTEPIPQNVWYPFLDHIKKHNKKYHFKWGPGAFIEGMALPNPPETQELKDSPIIFSNDVDFATKEVEKQMSEKMPLVVNLTPDMGFSDLIGEQRFNEKTGQFSYEPKFVLKALQEGRTVILNGALAPTLYQQLFPLFFGVPPQVHVNGEFIKTTGRLISVMPLSSEDELQIRSSCHRVYDFNYYRELFPNDKSHVNNIEKFYAEAKKFVTGLGDASGPILSYKRLEGMIAALQNGKLHPHNPIKGLFLYDYVKGSENYAHLNVLGKIIFCPKDLSEIRQHKLKQLLTKFNIRSKDDMKKYQWRILNCFNGGQLADYLHPDFTVNEDKLYALVKKTNMDEVKSEPPERKSHVKKREKQLRTLIVDPSVQLIMLKGKAGVGKTFGARELKNEYPFYEGLSNVNAWREDKTPGKIKILFIDEATMFKPGMLDFLKNDLSPDHKVILAGNPETDPERYYHEFFSQAHQILYEMPEDPFLLETILSPGLGPFKDKAPLFLTALHLAEEFNPLYPYSNRDLHNVVERFKVIVKDVKPVTDQHIVEACVGEFAGTIKDKEQRHRFIKTISQKCHASSPRITGDYVEINGKHGLSFYPFEKSYIIQAVKQNIKLRELDLQNRLPYFKRGMLIEGIPGLRKSSLYEDILYENGFREDSIDTQKKYYKITADNSGKAAEILKNAFHEGAVVILDEINLNPAAEFLLNKLMTEGKDEENQLAKKPGFMIFSSQNPSSEKGRKLMSPAFLNRFHVVYMDPYTPEELTSLAAKEVRMPDEFVKVHKKWEREYPHIVGPRTFFNALKKARAVPKLSLSAMSAIRQKMQTGHGHKDEVKMGGRRIQKA